MCVYNIHNTRLYRSLCWCPSPGSPKQLCRINMNLMLRLKFLTFLSLYLPACVSMNYARCVCVIDTRVCNNCRHVTPSVPAGDMTWPLWAAGGWSLQNIISSAIIFFFNFIFVAGLGEGDFEWWTCHWPLLHSVFSSPTTDRSMGFVVYNKWDYFIFMRVESTGWKCLREDSCQIFRENICHYLFLYIESVLHLLKKIINPLQNFHSVSPFKS